MGRIQIKVEKIKSYSFEELTSSKYTSPQFAEKLDTFSNWDLLDMFRKRHFDDILLKILSIELEKGYILLLKTKEDLQGNQFLIETIRELLIFPANSYQINILKGDPKSYHRIANFISKNDFVTRQIPKVLMDYFLSLEVGEIQWQNEDRAYMEECRIENSASAYNGGSGKLALIQRAIENGAKFIVEGQIILYSDVYQEWMKKNYPSFVSLVEKRNQVQIVEK